jgi:hypothetical protein
MAVGRQAGMHVTTGEARIYTPKKKALKVLNGPAIHVTQRTNTQE